MFIFCLIRGLFLFLLKTNKIMEVKLISINQPSIEGVKTAEELIVYCARVSNPNNQMNMETAPKLLKYLINHKHWSPLEMVNFCVEIKTSRAIAAQILRHRSFSFQEFSQRYSAATEIEPVQIRKQAEKNRQSSLEEFNPILNNLEFKTAASYIEEHMKQSINIYEELIKCGVAKECARMVLPLTTQTTLFMSGTTRSWVHYLELRCKEDTQKEHRDIANAIKEIFKENFPIISEALEF